MLTQQSKVKLFTHNDLDGIGCEILGRLAFGDNIDVTIVKNPQDASVKVNEFIAVAGYEDFDKIFITDISVSNEVAQRIEEVNEGNWILLDHHGTAEYLNEYRWASVRVDGMMGKEAGTNMFFEFLVMQGFFVKEVYRDALSVLVEKIRRYDCWEWKDRFDDKEAGELNQLFYLVGKKSFVSKYIRKFNTLHQFSFSEGSWREMFDDSDRTVINLDNSKKEAYIDMKEKQMTIKNILGYKVGVVYSEQYTSELGNVLSERNQELDFIAMIDMGTKKVSYRTVHEHVNLGKDVAKVFGGGGHAKASGSQFSSRVLDVAFKVIFGQGLIGKFTKWIDKRK
jgi:uncharacterized protein